MSSIVESVKTGADECCSGCVSDVVPLLLQQFEEMAELRKENEERGKEREQGAEGASHLII